MQNVFICITIFHILFVFFQLHFTNKAVGIDRFAPSAESVSPDNISIGVCSHIWWSVPPKFHLYSLQSRSQSARKTFLLQNPVPWNLGHDGLRLVCRKQSHMCDHSCRCTFYEGCQWDINTVRLWSVIITGAYPEREYRKQFVTLINNAFSCQ